ncbi:MAG TPA: hypothetical protein VK796_11340 [Cytophaga sp.]|jgi:hypothetical protein|nr:hypothetical protein [Cytophaga sp.]
MKIRFYFLLFISLYIIDAYSQNIESVKRKLIKDLIPKVSKYSWVLTESDNQIQLRYIDTFFINTSISPLRYYNGISNKLDTLYIKMRLEENWNENKIDSLKIFQKSILDPMIERFIAYYDSVNWVGIKSNKEMFLYQPVFYLARWNGLTKKERSQLENLVRLPDKTIGKIGLFVESTLSCYAMIEPKKVNIKIDNAYRAFSETTGVSLYICEGIYK